MTIDLFLTRTRRAAVYCQALLVLMLLFLARPASAQSDTETLSKWLSGKQQSAASTYWTREKIASAPAMRLPSDSGLEPKGPAALAEEEATGLVGSAPASAADPDAAQVARAFYAQDWAALDQEELAFGPAAGSTKGTAGIYTSYDVNTNVPLWQIYPHVWSGRLVFTTATGTSSCSATAIGGNNIVTAAHCVYDTTANVFYSNWVFAPAYRNGSTPYGTFTASVCSVLTAWRDLTGNFNINTWSRHDVAVCTMNRNSAGQTLNSAVGSAGRLWNAGTNQLAFLNGYPARIYTDATIGNGPGQYLRSCTAETFQRATETLGGGCNWSRGISGGSWLVGYKPFQVTGQVNSVTSGFIVGQQNLYGARFNSSNIVTLCNARSCG